MVKPAPLKKFHDLTPPAGEAWFVETEDGRRVRFAVWKGNGDATALVLSGRTEPIEKYSEPVARLLAMGFSVVVIDWRGHGLSDRHHREPRIGHVETFEEYQLDLAAVLRSQPLQDLPQEHFLVAHSTGCAIGLQALQAGLAVEKAVFSSPFWGAPVKQPLKGIVNSVIWLVDRLGMGGKRFPGSGTDPYAGSSPYEGNVLTSCPDQYALYSKFQIDEPELQLGGFSLRWILEAQRCFRDIRRKALPSVPVLTFLGGDETLVSADAIREIGTSFPNGKFVEIEGGRHELFCETSQIREKVWREIEEFIR